MFKSSKHIGVISYASRHGRKRREKRQKEGKIHCVALCHKNSRSLLQTHLVSECQSLKRGSFNDLLLSPTFLRGRHLNTVALRTKFPTRPRVPIQTVRMEEDVADILLKCHFVKPSSEDCHMRRGLR